MDSRKYSSPMPSGNDSGKSDGSDKGNASMKSIPPIIQRFRYHNPEFDNPPRAKNIPHAGNLRVEGLPVSEHPPPVGPRMRLSPEQMKFVRNLNRKEKKKDPHEEHVKVNPKWSESQEHPIDRKGFNKTGRELEVMVNAFPITKLPDMAVYQYEVHVSYAGMTEEDKRVLRSCWMNEERKAQLPDAIYDGARTAWSTKYLGENGLFVQLPKMKGKFCRPAGVHGDVHQESLSFKMQPRRKILLNVINLWLEKKHKYDEYVVEALNFLDHLIRDWPASQFKATRRAYFFDTLEEMPGFENCGQYYQTIGTSGAKVQRGIFQTIRPTPNGLVLNMDTCYGVFFAQGSLLNICRGFLKLHGQSDVAKELKPRSVPGKDGLVMSTPFLQIDKLLKGLKVFPYYEGCPFKGKGFNILRLIPTIAEDYMIDIKDKASGTKETVSIAQYFRMKYSLELEHPQLPLVQMEREEVIYPLELLAIKGLQRWPNRLNEWQAGIVIKFSAARPKDRLDAIFLGKKVLAHERDPQLQRYGFQVGTDMIKTKARLLPNPEIQFGNMKHNPGVSGKWDLRQKRFLKANKQILSNWVVGYFIRGHNPLSPAQLEAWIDGFMKAYRQHGGLVNNLPQTCELREDIAQSVKQMYDKGLVYGSEPQLLIIIVNEKDAFGYSRIKKSCDCRFGVPSQVLWSGHCSQNRPQYHSNVLMKVNAKLGGTTNRAVPTSKATALRPSSAIIGVDVTHAPKGTFTPSIAAMSLSNDALGVRYMGNCQINGEGPFIAKEIIDIKIMREILEPLMKEWIRDLGQGRDYPHNIYYFRDGVSDSELHHVLNTEIPAVRRIMAESTNVDPWTGKITVVVANKRHHLRAWPNPKDVKNRDQHGNPLPGTVIDRDVVGPHGWDFLLYAHTALQGTARPVHYKVLLDEIGHKPEELENMIYEQSYQYIRSTTSVGIHPAIYYAHLITARARHHEDRPADMGPQLSRDTRQARTPALKNLLQKRNKTESDEELLKEVMPKKKLLQFKESANRLMYSMWFV